MMATAAAVLAAPAHPAVQVLTFVEPLAGFPDHRDFALITADASGSLFWLQAVAPDGPRFLAIPASAYFPDYAPVLPVAVTGQLGISADASARVYCLVTVLDGDVATATANLRAPVVVEPVSRRACQVVLTDSRLPMRRPLRR